MIDKLDKIDTNGTEYILYILDIIYNGIKIAIFQNKDLIAYIYIFTHSTYNNYIYLYILVILNTYHNHQKYLDVQQ